MRPRRIWLERDARGHPRTRWIIARFPGVPVREIDGLRRLPRGPEGRRDLAVGLKRGRAVRPFRGARARGAPEYFVAGALGCPCDCAYCYLQGYLDSPVPTVFANAGAILEDLAAHLARTPRSHVHLGHLSDGLLLEPLAGIAAGAVSLLRRHPGATLEIRTKGARVDALPADPPPNVVVSWTFSPRVVVERFEGGAASLAARIEAARAARALGYRIGIRVDPILRFPGWREAYRELAATLVGRLRGGGVRDCVLGAFRFAPEVEPALRARPEGAALLGEEFVAGPDGKRRYFRPLRAGALRALAGRLGGHFPLALAMETGAVWRDVFGMGPERVCPAPGCGP